jgi:hypothetical protein
MICGGIALERINFSISEMDLQNFLYVELLTPLPNAGNDGGNLRIGPVRWLVKEVVDFLRVMFLTRRR